MDQIWLKHGDHYAVKQFDERTDIGVLYLPEGTQLVHSGDVIVLDDDGVYRLGNRCAGARQDISGLDLHGISPNDILKNAGPEGEQDFAEVPAILGVGAEKFLFGRGKTK